MSKPFFFRSRVGMMALLRRLAARTEGVAAVEFALIAPIMLTLFVGVVEMSQAVTANRRVTQVGSTTGDLVARSDATISDSDILDIMKVGSYLLAPFASNTLTVDIRVIGTSTTATATKLQWICSYNGANPSSVSCSCPKTPYPIPAGLVGTNDFVVMSTVTYGYRPPIFDKFMKSAFGGAGGTYSMQETVYLKPRSNSPRLNIGSAPTCDW